MVGKTLSCTTTDYSPKAATVTAMTVSGGGKPKGKKGKGKKKGKTEKYRGLCQGCQILEDSSPVVGTEVATNLGYDGIFIKKRLFDQQDKHL